MDSLLIISEEPALSETLASELPGMNVEHVRFKEAAAALSENRHRLIVVDEAGNNSLPDTGRIPVVRVTRPARLRELLYTIRERLQGKTTAGREELALPYNLKLSISERVIRDASGNTQIPLTEKETELLQCLLTANGQVVPRDLLLKSIWGYSDDIATHTLETHIYRLRGKLRQASESLDIISSDEGGYLLKT